MIKKIRYVVFRLIIISLGTILVFTGYMFFNQKSYIYFPDSQDFDNCPGFADSEKIREGETRMYYTGGSSENIAVYYHGNAGSACDRSFIKDKLKSQGYAFIFVEYSGYSGDTKKPSKNLILKDVENVDKFLKTLPYEKLVLMGTSLGSAVAAYHQTLHRPDKIILFAPFDKLSSVGKIHYQFLPINMLLREEYDTAHWLKNYTGKIIIIHGADDEIIPIKLAEALFGIIPSTEKEFVKIENETHNTLHYNSTAWESAINFLKK